MKRAIVVRGDALDAMAGEPTGSFGGLLCDPPYGLRIFGASWDQEVPGPAVWREARRVLRPGAWALAFGATRTVHRLMAAMEAGGLELCDLVVWLFGTGFPKGASLRPAVQPIVLARAPGGRRGLAIEACRTDGVVLAGDRRRSPRGRRTFWGAQGEARAGERHHPAGRWPTNLLLGHGPGCGVESGCLPGCPVEILGGESGLARFFYCPKPAGREIAGNAHPTKKPVRLTSYLGRLIAGEAGGAGERLAVPYCGSGSELVGGLRAGWGEVWGVEWNRRWVEVSRERLAAETGA